MKHVVLMIAIILSNFSLASDKLALLNSDSDSQAHEVIHHIKILQETGRQLKALANTKEVHIKPLLPHLRELYDQQHDESYEDSKLLPSSLEFTYPQEVQTLLQKVEYLTSELERINEQDSNNSSCCDPLAYVLPDCCTTS